MKKTLRILGIRGIPAAHGGFETFAEYLALHLVEQGWRVIVYCQEDGEGPVTQDTWRGVERIRMPIKNEGPLGTIIFDWKATADAAGHKDLCLTLGYNTAVFCAMLRARGVTNVINMDGIEWARAKWGPVAKAWFWFNERMGCWLGDHLVADHPEIKAHLATRVRADKITTIAYGAPAITLADPAPLAKLGVEPGRFLSVIARPEPENSLLEIVRGFSAKPRGYKLLVLGKYDKANPYHAQVLAAAGPEVVFAGAIYDKSVLSAIRFHSRAYVHGHQVGGTNPSLVEALGAGNAVIAHDNRFNRWVAGEGAAYFSGAEGFDEVMSACIADDVRMQKMRTHSRQRFEAGLTWPHILSEYERLLDKHLSPSARAAAVPVAQVSRSK